MRSPYKKPVIMCPISDQFNAYTGDTDLAILLNRDTFEPNPAVYASQEASSSKDTWGMVVRGVDSCDALSPPPSCAEVAAQCRRHRW